LCVLKPYFFYDCFWEYRIACQKNKGHVYNKTNALSKDVFNTDSKLFVAALTLGFFSSENTKHVFSLQILHDINNIISKKPHETFREELLYKKFFNIYAQPELSYSFSYNAPHQSFLYRNINFNAQFSISKGNGFFFKNDYELSIKTRLFNKKLIIFKNLLISLYGGFVKGLDNQPLNHKGYFTGAGPYDFLSYQDKEGYNNEFLSSELTGHYQYFEELPEQASWLHKADHLFRKNLPFNMGAHQDSIGFQGGLYKLGMRFVLPLKFDFLPKKASPFFLLCVGSIWGVDPLLNKAGLTAYNHRAQFSPIVDLGIGFTFNAGVGMMSLVFQLKKQQLSLQFGTL
jgi:hypothetical protein